MTLESFAYWAFNGGIVLLVGTFVLAICVPGPVVFIGALIPMGIFQAGCWARTELNHRDLVRKGYRFDLE